MNLAIRFVRQVFALFVDDGSLKELTLTVEGHAVPAPSSKR